MLVDEDVRAALGFFVYRRDQVWSIMPTQCHVGISEPNGIAAAPPRPDKNGNCDIRRGTQLLN